MGRRKYHSAAKKEPLTKIQRDPNRQELLSRIRHMMLARVIGMSPFPFEPRQFYKLVWGEERLMAMAVLPIEMFECSDAMRVHSTECMDTQTRPYTSFRLNLGMKLPCERNGNLYDNVMPEGDRATLNAWAKLRLRLMVDRDEVIKATEGLLNTAVTYGQIRAFWPTVEQFMSLRAQEMMQKHRKSRPSLAMHNEWDKAIKRSTRDVDIMLVEGAMFDTHDLSDPVGFIY
jgi:hypothetical protein